MTLPMAAWRTTYTPGNWLVLAGPTMLVVMLPAPARASGLVNDLWRDIVSAQSVDGLLKLVGEVGLDGMPDFGAFFWDQSGLHGLARGRVRVVDTETGDVALEGSGSVLWNEASLGGTRHLRIDLEPVNQDEVLQLPLVVGAVAASAIYLTTAPEALVRFPTYEQLGVLPKIPALGVRPRQRARAQAVVDDTVAAAEEPAVEEAVVEPMPDAEPTPVAAPTVEPARAEEAAAPVANEAPEPAVLQEQPADEPEGIDEIAPVDVESPTVEPLSGLDAETDGGGLTLALDDVTVTEPEPEPEPDPSPIPPPAMPAVPLAAAVPPPAVPVVPAPTPAPERAQPVVIPPRLGEIDDDAGGTIFSTGLAATHKPAPAAERAEPQVLAVPCVNGHANAPGSRSCRLCHAPVDSSNPRLIRRPVLAGVHTNAGDFADIISGVVVGRSPDPAHGPSGAYLLRVPSPSSDISRNHVLVTTKDWNVIVTDLHSTNGTTVLPLGESPFTLRDGASVQVELGTVLDLGDGVSLRIEPPRA
ncbi:FHA domain-containing protein [Tessaracoccus defluvii]